MSHIARWDRTRWEPLGSGLDGGVTALVEYNGELIVGGAFTVAGDLPASHIARWDGVQWRPLASGMNGAVYSLTVYNGELIAGGEFTIAGGVTANRVASWDGTRWLPLDTGMNYPVTRLTVYRDELIACGLFTMAGGVTAPFLAGWNGTQWRSLGSGFSGGFSSYYINRLATYNDELIVSGTFYIAGGVVARGIARWNGVLWQSVGDAIAFDCSGLATYGGELIVGGSVNATGASISRWNGTQWRTLDSGLDANPYCFTTYNDDLVVGGLFNYAGGLPTGKIAKWDGTQWHTLGVGMNSHVYALAAYNGQSIAGGRFVVAGGSGAARIAYWDGARWRQLGQGLGGYYVNCLAIFNQDLVAGGAFNATGGVRNVARWNGSTWQPLGSGTNDTVNCLTVYNGELIAGGAFTTAGGASANRIARWDGTQWQPLGSGMDDTVWALAGYKGKLIAGGWFTTAGGATVNGIASWDGTQWHSLGGGMDTSVVYALAVYENNLIAGGWFATAGGGAANSIAQWNGFRWQPIGGGTSGRINVLTVYNGDLLAGGDFTDAGGASANNIARWDGTDWRALGDGLDNEVDALAVFGHNLMVGGSFTKAGTHDSAYFARWGCPGDQVSAPGKGLEPKTKSAASGQPADPACSKGGQRSAAGGVSGADPIYLFSGEFYHEQEDLRIPGRGFDFVWARKYRSREFVGSAMGNGWDFSYNIYVEAGENGAMLVHDGNTRTDEYPSVATDRWETDGFFRVLTRQGSGADETYTLTFEDKGAWVFYGLNDATRPGKIKQSIDRNGNSMSFEYDDQGRLSRIKDTLNVNNSGNDTRAINIAYVPGTDYIQSVTDWHSRAVRYEYYQDNEDGGSPGDLKSVTTPAVTDTPNENDFAGKKTVYTYSKGFEDDQLNHNLLTITDPKEQTYLRNIYATATDFSDINYDRVVQQVWGNDLDAKRDLFNIHYAAVTPDSSNGNAVVKAIINDRMGNVHEYFYNENNLCTLDRAYAGRATPDQPTTDTENRPANKLRDSDPTYFETMYEYNSDSLVSSIYHPNGNITENVYESDLDPACDRRSRGNLREIRHMPAPGAPDQTVITEKFEYGELGGGCCANFVTKYTDGKNQETQFQYDSNGNLLHIVYLHTSVTEDFEYDPSTRQLIAHKHLPNDSGHRRRDEFVYYQPSDGAQNGYLKQRIIDSGGLNLTTNYQYDVVGNVIKVTQPVSNGKSRVTDFWVNQLNQVVQAVVQGVDLRNGSTVNYTRKFWYDANDNLTRIEVADIDEEGQPRAGSPVVTELEYGDVLNNLTKIRREVSQDSFIETQLQYDDNRNLKKILYGEATALRQPNNTVSFVYDTRDMLFQKIRAAGDATLHSTTQFDYDGNGNLRYTHQGIEDAANIRTTQVQYDQYDRPKTRIDAMGNSVTVDYDLNGNVTSRIVKGNLPPGTTPDVRLAESSDIVFDQLNRRTHIPVKFFDPANQSALGSDAATDISYTDNSLVRTITDANTHPTTIEYDGANRFFKQIDAKLSWISSSYDLDSNPISTAEHEISDYATTNDYNTTRTYDILGRLATSVDNANKTVTYYYDSRDNLVKTMDTKNNVVRYEYDGLNRLTATVRTMTVPTSGTISTSQVWDDSSRLVSQTDANNRTTSYTYDPLNRVVQVTYADATVWKVATDTIPNAYDVHDNPLYVTDANGTVMHCTYDLLNRLTARTITRGPGVSSETTTESFQYDGLSRLVEAVNNDSKVARNYDSMGNLLSETLTIYGPSGTRSGTVSATHDGVGNELTVTYPGLRQVTWNYDAIDQKSNMTSTTGGLPVTYKYAGPGRVQRAIFGSDVISGGYSYDSRRRIDGISYTRNSGGTQIGLIAEAYGWDDMHNKTSRQYVAPGGLLANQSFGYDSIYRLIQSTKTQARLPDIVTEYKLDGAGNRTRVTGRQPDAGAYTQSDAAAPVADLQMNQYTRTPFDRREYDANGNLTVLQPSLTNGDFDADGDVDQDDLTHFRNCMRGPGVPADAECTAADVDADGDVDMADYLVFQTTISGSGVKPAGGFTFTYDGHNQLVEAVDGAGKHHRYLYDALGRRIAKITDYQGAGQQEVRYFYRGSRVVEEQDQAGATLATYTYGNYVDEPLSMRRGSQEYYYLADDMFNTVAVADSTGALVEQYEYDDFGKPTIYAPNGDVRATSAIGNPYLFTGRHYDPETGLYYYRSRYYDPRAGRFTSRDRIGIWGDPGSMGNPYVFVLNNPWSMLDPYGYDSWGSYIWDAARGVGGFAQGMKEGATNAVFHPVRSWTRLRDASINSIDMFYNAGYDPYVGVAHTFGAAVPAFFGAGSVMDGNDARRRGDLHEAVKSYSEAGANIFAIAAPMCKVAKAGKAGAAAKTGLGDLTASEVAQIRSVVDSAGRPLEVVGSAAKGMRRGVGSDLPIGKGPGTMSDIDYLVPPGSMGYYGGLESLLPGIDPMSGIIPGVHNPYMGPAIRFEPNTAPFFVPAKSGG